MQKTKEAIRKADSEIRIIEIKEPTKYDSKAQFLYIPVKKPTFTCSTLRLETTSSKAYKTWEASLDPLMLSSVIDCLLGWMLLVYAGQPVPQPVGEIQLLAVPGFLLSIDILREYGLL
jgi:hypothetical protein